MRIVATPYRWLWRTWWQNITHWGWDIRNGVSNLVIFFEAVWWFRSWDWTGMVELLEVCAREMRRCQAGGLHTGSEREAHRLMIVETLCKRLLAGEYFENAGYHRKRWAKIPDHRKSQIAKHSTYMAYQDAAYLGKMLKFVQHWWE